MKKIKIMKKIWAGIIALLLFAVSVSATVTMTDKSITTDESDLIIDFDDNYYRTDNATIKDLGLGESEILNWTLAYTHMGDPFYNASDAQYVTKALLARWNRTGDPYFNASVADTLQQSWMDIWNLTYAHIGDPFYNASDAQYVTKALMAKWNTSSTGGAPALTLIRNSNNNSWAVTVGNIQLAIDDLTTGNGTVWIPAGTYTLTQPIYINESGVKLIGENAGHWAENTGATFFKMGANTELLNISGALGISLSGVVVENIMFRNDGVSRDTYIADAITITYCTTPRIYRCGFNRINGSAIKIRDMAYSTNIIECFFQHCGSDEKSLGTIHFYAESGSMDCQPTFIERCIFEANNYSSIRNTGSPGADNVRIINNFFEGTPTGAAILGGFAESFISGNSFYGDKTTPASKAIDCDGQNLTISNNAISYYKMGIDGEGTGRNRIVSDNNVYGTSQYGIRGGDHMLISNNHVRDCGSASTYAGIFMNGVNSSICDNTIEGADKSAIWLYGTTNCLVDGNYILDNAYDVTDNGILVSNSGHHNIITNNYFDDNVATPVTGTTSAYIKDNPGYDYSSYEAIPFGTSTPYDTVFAGATWIDTLNDDFHVYDGSHDLIFNANATVIQQIWMDKWNLSYTHKGDPWFNASASHGITSTNLLEWALAYRWIGDPFFNASDAQYITKALMAQWNASATSGAPSLALIRNSNNNSWSVDGTDDDVQIQAAIDDVGTWGTVWVGTDTTITSEIDMDGCDGVMLDFDNHECTVSGDISFINFTNCNYAGLRNVEINVATQTGSIIKLYAGTDANRVDFPIIINVHIDNTGGLVSNYNGSGIAVYKEHNFTGIEIYADDMDGVTTGLYGRIFKGLFEHITIEGSHKGIEIKARTRGYVNGCTFMNIYFNAYKYACIDFLDSATTGGINENNFYSVQSQTSVYSIYGMKTISGEGNRFNDMLMWDFHISEDGRNVYWIDTKGWNTFIADAGRGTSDYVLDNGLGSEITCGNRHFYYDADYDYKITTNGSHYFVRQGDYGHMPVSGTYDRSTDFEALMLAIFAHDDITVKLGNGTYEPDQGIAFNGKNITIEGRDDHTTIIKCHDGTQYASGLFSMINAGVCNITLRNLVFSGSGASDSSIGVYFGFAENVHGLTIENCVFINWTAGTSRAIYSNPSTDDIASNVKIVDNEFFNCDYAITLEGDSDPSIVQYADVSHNYFKECQFSIFCDYVFNSSFSSNRIISTIASSDGISLDDSIDNIIDGNNIVVADNGIIEIASADYNMIFGNSCRHSGIPILSIGGNTNHTLNIV